jgi:hypothetical protein
MLGEEYRPRKKQGQGEKLKKRRGKEDETPFHYIRTSLILNTSVIGGLIL